jgi:hypothetical protein
MDTALREIALGNAWIHAPEGPAPQFFLDFPAHRCYFSHFPDPAIRRHDL